MGARPPRIFLERIRSQRAARAHHEDRVRGCGAVLRDPWSQQSDRRLYAGHRSRSLHRPPTWDLRLIASPPAGSGLFFQGLTPNGRNVIMVAPQTGQEVPPTPRGALLQLSKASPEREEEIMTRLQTRLSTWMMVLCVLFVMSGISALAKPQAAGSTDDQTSTTTSKKKKKKAKTKTDTSASGDQAAATDTSATAAKKTKKSKKAASTDAASASSDSSAAASDTGSKKSSKKSKKSAAAEPASTASADMSATPTKKTRKSKKAAADSSAAPAAAAASTETSAAPAKSTRKSKKSAMDSGAPATAASEPAPATHAAANSTAPANSMAAPSNSMAPAKTAPTKASSKAAASAAISDPQIASAKSNGMVWVNTDSGVYHKGGRWYGKTKTGKFMSEADDKAAGYKASDKD